ncbi:hypothetical protein AA0535_1064 [Asaia krungthepensis NRIC 0535]|uniref:Uncharacterized protein n=1 Tax=Asaia krungthepensis NRIC 0535 TaxID=1307925 RepID=A0ABQ0Q167_9PROT|nr:hypothetical protein AA0535_1064 [Asaia krungthepensis NRIC 0535]
MGGNGEGMIGVEKSHLADQHPTRCSVFHHATGVTQGDKAECPDLTGDEEYPCPAIPARGPYPPPAFIDEMKIGIIH